MGGWEMLEVMKREGGSASDLRNLFYFCTLVVVWLQASLV